MSCGEKKIYLKLKSCYLNNENIHKLNKLFTGVRIWPYKTLKWTEIIFNQYEIDNKEKAPMFSFQ